MKQYAKILGLCVAVFLMPAAAWSKDKISFATVADPALEAPVWALANGKVRSDKIDVQVNLISVNALIQSTMTKQYDALFTSAIAVPRVHDLGIQPRVLAIGLRYLRDGIGNDIWVAKDGPIKDIKDLKGKRIAVTALNSSDTTNSRVVLNKVFGFNIAFDGGDIHWVELPPAAMQTALSAGRIDAARLVHRQVYEATMADQYRSIGSVQANLFKLYGVEMPTIVILGYQDRIQANPEAYKELTRLLKESADYMQNNKQEVYEALAKKHNIDVKFFDFYYTKANSAPYSVRDSDIVGLDKSWETAKELGLIKSYPPAKSMISEFAVRD